MGKAYFTYYNSYYLASENLNDEDFIIFNQKLMECQFSEEDTIQMVNNTHFESKELNDAWKIVSEQVKKHDRSSKNYRVWKDEVFKRDNHQCVQCESKIEIQAHHIIRWCDSIEQRYSINNGMTLCVSCHKAIHKMDNL